MIRRTLNYATTGVVLILMACAEAAHCGELQPGVNLVLNGDFEHGGEHWRLVTRDGTPGGKIVEEADGNHALTVDGGGYWTAQTERYFGDLGLERWAGKQLTISFRACGDADAYPGLLLYCAAGDRSSQCTLFWKTKWVQKNITLTPAYRRYERTVLLSKKITKVHSLNVYNATRRGRLLIDDIKLTIAEPRPEGESAKSSVPAEWQELTFTDAELIELANTHNYLVTQWALLYGLLAEVERTAYYAKQEGVLAADQARAVRGMHDRVLKLFDKHQALQSFYIDRFGERYRDLIELPDGTPTPKKSTRYTPWKFYRHDSYAGRKLIFEVGDRRSCKPAFVAFEKAVAQAHAEANRLLAQLQRDAKLRAPSGGKHPDQIWKRPDRCFDERGRPLRFAMAVRSRYPNRVRYLGNDYCEQHAVVPRFDAQGRMTIREPEEGKLPTDYPKEQHLKPSYYWETKHYDLKHRLVVEGGPKMRREYIHPEFKKRVLVDPELQAHTEFGPASPFGYRGARTITSYLLNIFHPEVKAHVRQYFEELWRLFDGCAHAFALEYAAEPALWIGHEGKSVPFGYSQTARDLFRGGLQGKFGTVERLNVAWRTSYASFAAIEPPTHETMISGESEHLPLIYEFHKFRRRKYADHFKLIYDAAKRGGSKPVVTRIGGMYFNGTTHHAFDALRMAQVTDVLCHHGQCGTYRHLADLNYFYSLTRYLDGKPRGNLEFYCNQPEGYIRHPGFVLISRYISNLWHSMSWGVKLMAMWTKNPHMGRWDGADFRSGLTLANEHEGAVPLVRETARHGLEAVVFTTEIVPREIGLVAPYDATLVCQPDGHIQMEGRYVHRFLDLQYREYFCVPEELIASGRETLKGYKVLMTPYALWVSDALQSKLLEWVLEGGVLINIGPLGYWNEYGQPSRKLIDACFGTLPIHMDKKDNVYHAAFPYDAWSKSEKAKVEAVLPHQDPPVVNLVSARHGKGSIYITADPSILKAASTSTEKILAAIDEAVGVRGAWCQRRSFDLVVREHAGTGTRYLIAINRSVQEPAEDTVIVRGEYSEPVDIAIRDGCKVPARRVGGMTMLSLRLTPGEGTCIRLGKYEPKPIDAAAIGRLTMAESGRDRRRVLDVLSRVRPDGDRIAYARALAARSLALRRLRDDDLKGALAVAEKAASLWREPPPASPAQPTIARHMLAPPKIDADPAEWQSGEWTAMGPSRFKVAWDAKALYFFVEVRDDYVRNPDAMGRLWSGDSVEIFLDVLNAGTGRTHGPLDRHYVASCNGPMMIRFHKILASCAASQKTSDGYRLEIAVANAETHLQPLDGYVLGYYIRALDFRDRKYLGAHALTDRKLELDRTTAGWQKMKLVGGPKTVVRSTGAFLDATKNRIVIRGQENTIETVALDVGDFRRVALTDDALVLGTHLHIEPGVRLSLGDETLRAQVGSQGLTFTADPRGQIHLTGDPLCRGLDCETLKRCRFTSDRDRTLTVEKRLLLKVVDHKDRPITGVDVNIQASEARTKRLLFDVRQPLDKKGTTHFSLPAWTLTVSDGKAKIEEKVYDLIVEDVIRVVPYAVENVRAARVSEVKVSFHHFRGDAK